VRNELKNGIAWNLYHFLIKDDIEAARRRRGCVLYIRWGSRRRCQQR